METDRELLELAAKAADVRFGFDGKAYADTPGACWNPLIDDGDALRLAVKLKLLVDICSDYVCVCNEKVDPIEQEYGKNDCESTRRAIVRAAAAIGEAEHGN